LSEIILQQTRIDQGTAYYLRFVSEFPSISDLASASEDQVLKLWQGLGYYSRARNLHFTARQIHENFNGVFPDDYKTIRSLKGIGDYTAAAICSISFNLEYPAVDGNVYRVFARFFGINDPIDSASGKKKFHDLATKLITGTNPGMHNQAMMEFGALQCTPRNPDCGKCPLNKSCYAFLKNKINDLPVKKNKTIQRDRFFNYLVITDPDHTWLRKRTGKDIWTNLFEFPIVETGEKSGIEQVVEADEFRDFIRSGLPVIEHVSNWKIHLLSHQRINYRFIRIRFEGKFNLSDHLIRVNKEDIFNFAVPKLLDFYLNETGNESLFI
jgi:A/G-specific adenine glycosylase